MTAEEAINKMTSLGNEKDRVILERFFKTGEGEYGYGDKFLGIKVPKTREVVKEYKDLDLDQVHKLATNQWHEVRLLAFQILVSKFEKCVRKKDIAGYDNILLFYLDHAEYANNWDLVDTSVPKVLGYWLTLPSNLGDEKYKIEILDNLANSDNLWKQRMSIVCTWKTLQEGNPFYTLRYAEKHLRHPHDLMHKAVGWMLREMGKRVSMDLLRQFLDNNIKDMPRTCLRYAIEKMDESERKKYMNM